MNNHFSGWFGINDRDRDSSDHNRNDPTLYTIVYHGRQ